MVAQVPVLVLLVAVVALQSTMFHLKDLLYNLEKMSYL